MIIFIDTLAGVKYPDEIAKLPKRYGTGYFFEEFGNAKSQIAKDLKSGRSFIRVQGLWSASHKYNDEKKAIQIAKELNKLGKLYYSPYCEAKEPAAKMLALFKKIEKVAPNLILVNSPISGGQWVDGYINEIHHNDKPSGMPKGQYIYSFDGLHQPDCDVEIYKKRHLNDPKCIAFGIWALQHNAKINAKDKTPAKLRKCKPTVDLNNSLIFQIENAKAKVSLPKGWLYKSHSEQHHNVDPRANKPVILTPKGKRFKQVTLDKHKLRESGSHDGRQVWRFSQWGYKTGRVLEIKADGKLIGTVDGGFRQNEYREKT
jgi:hypothetical protein